VLLTTSITLITNRIFSRFSDGTFNHFLVLGICSVVVVALYTVSVVAMLYTVVKSENEK